MSIAIVDEGLQPTLEPGTPSVKARLDLVWALTEAELPCGVSVAPVLPCLTDTDEHLARMLGQLALSANSPYWQGEDTNYASFRSQAQSRWPSAGRSRNSARRRSTTTWSHG